MPGSPHTVRTPTNRRKARRYKCEERARCIVPLRGPEEAPEAKGEDGDVPIRQAQGKNRKPEATENVEMGPSIP